MRRGIHPKYRSVVFRDTGSGTTYRTRSTTPTSGTIELDGQTYPLVTVETSAASHPFWTGSQRILDTAGRVERFNARYGAAARPTRKQG